MSHHGDIEDLKKVLLWARGEKLQLAKIRVGEVELELVDLELIAQQQAGGDRPKEEQTGDWKPEQPPAPADMYAQLAQQRGLHVEAEELVDELDRGRPS